MTGWRTSCMQPNISVNSFFFHVFIIDNTFEIKWSLSFSFLKGQRASYSLADVKVALLNKHSLFTTRVIVNLCI